MKNLFQRLVREFHIEFCHYGIPHSVAICFHNIERRQYGIFEELISYFVNLGFQCTGPDEFISPSYKRQLFISFDDNYRNWHAALPLLERMQLKVTFYVNALPLRDRATSSEIESYFARLGHGADMLPLDSSELVELASHGHIIGNHTYSHKKLSALSLADAEEEIRRGRAELEELLGRPVLHFAYPYGMPRNFPRQLRRFCERTGVRTIASATPGLLHSEQSHYDLNRTGVNLEESLSSNLINIGVSGFWFTKLTGKSALGSETSNTVYSPSRGDC